MPSFPKSPGSASRQRLLASRAQWHRSLLNFPELLLWQELRAGRLGVYFRRQVPLAGRFIADFVAPSVGLVVEVDGMCHRLKRAADARRDEKLRRLGYHVLRLDADVVMHRLHVAVQLVRERIGEVRG